MLYREPREYKRGRNLETPFVGGQKRTNKLIVNQGMMERIEEIMLNISFKSKRSESQRNERRNKRNKGIVDNSKILLITTHE